MRYETTVLPLTQDPELVQILKSSFSEALGLAPLPAFLNEEQTAQVTGRKAASLRVARSTGKNCPPFSKIGKSVRYNTELLARWVLDQTVTSTGEYQAKQEG